MTITISNPESPMRHRTSVLLAMLVSLACSSPPATSGHNPAKDLVRRFIEAQEQGFLGTTRNPHITVVRAIVSGAVVVTEQHVTFETKPNGEWQPTARTQITVFDIEHDRIARIVDFWQPAPAT